MAKTELEKVQEKATALGIVFKEDDTVEVISELIEKKKEENKPKKKTSSVVLKDVNGKDVDEKDYFWPLKVKDKDGKETGEVIYAPDSFHKYNGDPVTREDLLAVFNRIFDPKDGFLFYKDRNSELYLVIVPLKLAASVGEENNSIGCDFQRHAVSFLYEGSVNIETLKRKLTQIRNHKSIKGNDR